MHTTTCWKNRAGDLGCWLGRFQPIQKYTVSIHLKPFINENGKLSYTEETECHPDPSDCLSSRKFSKTTIAVRNRNLLYWEIKRRQIDYNQILQVGNFGYVAGTATVVVHDLLTELQSGVQQLKPERRQRIFSTLKNRRGMVVRNFILLQTHC